MQSQEPVPQGYLAITIERVVEEIGHALDKHLLSKYDYVVVNSTVDLSYSMFDRLRSREWLNCWDISAALEMIDRHVFVQLGISIPLHRRDMNGNVTPISNPFCLWRGKIDDHKRKSKKISKGHRCTSAC